MFAGLFVEIDRRSERFFIRLGDLTLRVEFKLFECDLFRVFIKTTCKDRSCRSFLFCFEDRFFNCEEIIRTLYRCFGRVLIVWRRRFLSGLNLADELS